MIKTIHLVALLQVIVGEKIFCMTELFVTESMLRQFFHKMVATFPISHFLKV